MAPTIPSSGPDLPSPTSGQPHTQQAALRLPAAGRATQPPPGCVLFLLEDEWGGSDCFPPPQGTPTYSSSLPPINPHWKAAPQGTPGRVSFSMRMPEWGGLGLSGCHLSSGRKEMKRSCAGVTLAGFCSM